MFRSALVCWLLTLSAAAQAQQRQPANVSTLPQSSPQEFDLLDNKGNWMPFGTASNGAFSSGLAAKTVNLTSFGAKCDNATDDTTAIQNWLNKATPQTKLVGSPGQCVFKSALTIPTVDDLIVDFQGDGFAIRGRTRPTIFYPLVQHKRPTVSLYRVLIQNVTLVSDTADDWRRWFQRMDDVRI